MKEKQFVLLAMDHGHATTSSRYTKLLHIGIKLNISQVSCVSGQSVGRCCVAGKRHLSLKMVSGHFVGVSR